MPNNKMIALEEDAMRDDAIRCPSLIKYATVDLKINYQIITCTVVYAIKKNTYRDSRLIFHELIERFIGSDGLHFFFHTDYIVSNCVINHKLPVQSTK